MRILYALLFSVTLLNFSGVPEVLSGLFEDDSTFLSLADEESGKEDRQEKSKEDIKEEGKESLLSALVLFEGFGQGQSLGVRNCLLRDTGFIPEDHTPPPERA